MDTDLAAAFAHKQVMDAQEIRRAALAEAVRSHGTVEVPMSAPHSNYRMPNNTASVTAAAELYEAWLARPVASPGIGAEAVERGSEVAPLFAGVVVDAGGGRVEISVDRETQQYPSIGTGVAVYEDRDSPAEIVDESAPRLTPFGAQTQLWVLSHPDKVMGWLASVTAPSSFEGKQMMAALTRGWGSEPAAAAVLANCADDEQRLVAALKATNSPYWPARVGEVVETYTWRQPHETAPPTRLALLGDPPLPPTFKKDQKVFVCEPGFERF